jgi:NitT/TauT family transport system substrate-binding protein
MLSLSPARPDFAQWRGILLALLVILSGRGWTVSAAPAPTKITLLLDWLPAAEQGGYFCALADGYYQQAGLDVTIRPATAGTIPSGMLLLSGQAQFAMGTSDGALINRAHGLPIVAVMATMQHDPKAVMVHADSSIYTFPDLDGHKLAILPGNPWFLYVTKKFNLQHIQQIPATMNVANFLTDPTYSQECFVTSEPYFAEKKGVKVRTLLVKDTGYDTYRALLTTDSYVASHREAVQAFVTASIAGWRQYLREAPDGPADRLIMRENKEMFQDQISYSKNVMITGHWVAGDPTRNEDVGRLTLDRFADNYKILHDLGIIGEMDYHKAADLSFLPAR